MYGTGGGASYLHHHHHQQQQQQQQPQPPPQQRTVPQHFAQFDSVDYANAAASSNAHLQQQNVQQQPRDDVKTQFSVREGMYRLAKFAEFPRPGGTNPRAPGPGGQLTGRMGDHFGPSGAVSPATGMTQPTVPNAPVRVSFLDASECRRDPDDEDSADLSPPTDKICFNVGRELFVYEYKGVSAPSDLSKPIDKRTYKGTHPTAHDFNTATATRRSYRQRIGLLVGFSAGQVQLIELRSPQNSTGAASSCLFNEERLIDRTPVTCIKWVPGQPRQFLVSHVSGTLYLYDEQLTCAQHAPLWQLHKQGDRWSLLSHKSKSARNPLWRWEVGTAPGPPGISSTTQNQQNSGQNATNPSGRAAIHQFAFSPGDGAKKLAIVSQDGWLRIFGWATFELVAQMRSFFGGLLCVAWSQDGLYVATGGEDDLVTVFAVEERRVVCRCQGHKSWVAQVAFDPYVSLADSPPLLGATSGNAASTDDQNSTGVGTPTISALQRSPNRLSTRLETAGYRIGSVGHDTQLCLWDITDEVLRAPPLTRHRNTSVSAPASEAVGFDFLAIPEAGSHVGDENTTTATTTLIGTGAGGALVTVTTAKPKQQRKPLHQRALSIASRATGKKRASHPGGTATLTSTGSGSGGSSRAMDEQALAAAAAAAATAASEPYAVLGTKICPRMNEVGIVEPLVCKKVAPERLTALHFRPTSLVTACLEGSVYTWARPGMAPTATTGSGAQRQHLQEHPQQQQQQQQHLRTGY